MATHGDSLIRKTQKGISILAFETSKQSRILKKRMRIAALQKEVKADLRDLGNLVYNALLHEQAGILEEEEVKILVDNVRENKAEVEHLRDAIARLSRTRKHFELDEDYEGEGYAPEPSADEEPLVTVEAGETADAGADAEPETAEEVEASVVQPAPEPAPKPAPKKKAPAKKKAVEKPKDAAAKQPDEEPLLEPEAEPTPQAKD